MTKKKDKSKNIRISKKSITVFMSLVILLSGIAEAVYCAGGPDWSTAILMWIPAVSAFIAAGIAMADNKDRFNPIKLFRYVGIRFCNPLYVLLGVVIPFIYLYIPYRIYWFMHPENYGYTGVAFSLILKDLAIYTVVCVFISLITALGEEIGWRGFMLPANTQQIGDFGAMAFGSIFWCLWHFPLLIFGEYMEGTPLWYKLICFTLCIFPVGIIAAILTFWSKSVWPAAFLHAAHNAYDQTVFDIITQGDDKKFFVSETGIFTIICVWVIAIIMFVIYKKTKK